jgi:DNA-binding NarL/FixJ family response regulator
METIKVAIVDDHQIVRDGIKAMLLLSKNIKVIGEAADYLGLTKVLEKEIPEILVLDISMPGKSGIEITRELSESHPSIKILILSANTDEDSIIEAIKAGAKGFLPKDTPRDEFFEAINLVHSNEGYFGEKLSKIIYKSYIQHVKTGKNTNVEPSISERETEIINLLADGLSCKEIADTLFISPRTVESHKANILEKLNLKNNIELVKYAIKQGIVKL